MGPVKPSRTPIFTVSADADCAPRIKAAAIRIPFLISIFLMPMEVKWKAVTRGKEALAATARSMGDKDIRREARFCAAMVTCSLSSGRPGSTGLCRPEAVRPVPDSSGRLAAARARWNWPRLAGGWLYVGRNHTKWQDFGRAK